MNVKIESFNTYLIIILLKNIYEFIYLFTSVFYIVIVIVQQILIWFCSKFDNILEILLYFDIFKYFLAYVCL